MNAPLRIDGHTQVIAHLGYPTHSFKAPLIYNPYFAEAQIPAVVVPMGCRAEHFESVLRSFFETTNALGALITMPHKVSVMALLDDLSVTARVAGACNAVRRDARGRLVGDMFDGQGFVRGLVHKGVALKGRSALVVGSGGVGCAIAASLAQAGVAQLRLYDLNAASSQALAQRLLMHYPQLQVEVGNADPAGLDVVVNATPMGMQPEDPLPLDVSRLSPQTMVGEVVMSQHITHFLAQAQVKGCSIQVGVDMLFEMIPAYLDFFGLPTTTAQRLRELAWLPPMA